MLHGQQPVIHISSHTHTSELASHTDNNILQTGEDTPASPCDVDTTRGATDTGYKPSRYWRTDGGRDLRISLDSYRPPQAG